MREWKPIEEKLRRDLLGVLGVTTKSPLAYLVRERLKPEVQALYPWDGYTGFDSQLVKRTPILTDRAACGAHTVDELEDMGSQVKYPEVNVDNT